MTKIVVAREKVKYICDKCKCDCSDSLAVTVDFGWRSIHDGVRLDFCSDECARKWFAKDKERHARKHR